MNKYRHSLGKATCLSMRHIIYLFSFSFMVCFSAHIVWSSFIYDQSGTVRVESLLSKAFPRLSQGMAVTKNRGPAGRPFIVSGHLGVISFSCTLSNHFEVISRILVLITMFPHVLRE